MSGLSYEAWTLPWSASFHRKVARIPVVEGTGRGERSLFSTDGAASAEVDLSNFDRLDEIISDTAGSLIRVYDGTTIIHEWLAQRVERRHDDRRRTAIISGKNLASVFDQVIVYPYDYPVHPSRDPHWIWGSDQNLLSNGGYEDGTNLVDNPGFEDGTTDPWWAGAVDGVSATLEIETTEVDTGTYSAKCTPLLAGGGMSRMLRGLYPSKTYTVSARIKAGTGKTIEVGIGGPQTIGQGTADQIVYIEINPSDSQYEVQDVTTASGAWQSVSFDFVAGTNQTGGQLSIRDSSATPATFYTDVVSVTGYGVGMDPWQPSNIDAVTTFEASTDVTPDEGTYTGKITALDGAGIYQTLDGVAEGATYTGSIRLRNASGSARWALELRDQLGTRLGQTSVATSTTFQTLTVTATLPLDLPGDRRQLQLWLVNYSGGTATVYADSARLYRGRPATTWDVIVTELMDDATADHSADPRGTLLDWVDYSGLTTIGTAQAFTAWHQMTYGQVWDRGVDLGFEWQLVPKATPSGGLTHDLEWFVSDGMGTAGKATINSGRPVSGGSVVKRIPDYTAVMASGPDGLWVEDTDATALSNFGRLERAAIDRGLLSTDTLDLLAAEALAYEAANRTAVTVEVVASPDHPRPLVDYSPGDGVFIQLPPALAKEERRVQKIDYVNTVPTRYTIVGSRMVSGDAAAFELIRRVWRRFRPFEDGEPAPIASRPVAAGGGGGMATRLIVADDVLDQNLKRKADRVVSATASTAGIQAVLDEVEDQFSYGTVWLAGYFTFDSALTVPGNITLRGFNGGGGTGILGSGSITLGTVAELRDMSFQGSNRIVATGTNLIDNCFWYGVDAGVNPHIDLTGANTSVSRQVFIGSDSTAGCIRLNSTSNILISDISCNNNATGPTIRADTSSYFTIHGLDGLNSDYLLDFDSCANFDVSGVTGLADERITLDGCFYGRLDLNVSSMDYGIVLTDCEQIELVGWMSTVRDGVVLDDCDDCRVHMTIIGDGPVTDDTFDGIRLEGDSNRNVISNCKVKTIANLGGNQLRYGINISASTCDDNVVVSNDLRPSADFASDAYNDAGTGTVNTYPAHATYGDNFT